MSIDFRFINEPNRNFYLTGLSNTALDDVITLTMRAPQGNEIISPYEEGTNIAHVRVKAQI